MTSSNLWKGIRTVMAVAITVGLPLAAGYTWYVRYYRRTNGSKADEKNSSTEEKTEAEEKDVDSTNNAVQNVIADENEVRKEQLKRNSAIKTTRIDDHNKKRVLVLGLDQSGKSTFITAMSNRQYAADYHPTQGFSVVTTSIGEKALNFWEVGGAPKLRQHWGRYTDGTHLLIYIIDSSNTKIVDVAKEELTALVKANEHLDTIPWLIIASKQDLLGAMSPDELREMLNIPQVPKKPEKIVIGMELPAKGLKKGISKVKNFFIETTF